MKNMPFIRNTHSINNAPTRLANLKPLFAVIPIAALIACANQQDNTLDDPHHATANSVQHELAEVNFSQPDPTPAITLNPLTTSIEAEGPDLTSETTAPATETDAINNDPLLNNTQGEDPMTVLVIENPEILAQLATNHANNIAPLREVRTNKPSKRVFHFGFNQTRLSEEDVDLIEKHATYLKANPTLQVTVHGHTDAQGNPDYNLKLSTDRAKLVLNQLIKHGINRSRIKTVGWGGDYPLLNTLHFAENRRIEIEYAEIHFAANQ